MFICTVFKTLFIQKRKGKVVRLSSSQGITTRFYAQINSVLTTFSTASNTTNRNQSRLLLSCIRVDSKLCLKAEIVQHSPAVFLSNL